MRKNVFFLLMLMLTVSIKGFAVDYTFKSHAEVQAFYNAFTGDRIAVDNLTVSGNDIDQSDFDALEACIASVNVKLTIENVNNTNDGGTFHLDGFLTDVTQNGSIIIQNVNSFGWGGSHFLGQGVLPKHIHGDLVIDSTNIPFPGVDGWATNTSFGDIEEVDGDLILGSRAGLQKFNGSSFQQLQRVGGSFRLYMTGSSAIWDVPAPKLTYIGGDFEILGPDGGISSDGGTLALWDFEIIQNIQYIGGDVTVINCPNIQLGQSGDFGGTGYCYIRYLIDTGVINYACHNVLLGWEDDPVDLSTLGACLWGDGGDQDNPPSPLPDKDPSCSPTGIKAVKAAGFATVQPTYVKDNLNIESATDLAKVDVIDISGRTVKSFSSLSVQQNSLPLSGLSNGVYLVRIINVNSEVQTVKIVKQ